MNYIYDILLNFKEELYDFFEWNLGDDIMHIRKIPIFYIDEDQMREIAFGIVCMSDEFLERIKEKTEIFTHKNVKTYPFASLFSDGKTVIGLLFNQKGVSIGRSRMLIDEEGEVLDLCTHFIQENLPFTEISKLRDTSFQTRKEQKIKSQLQTEIHKLNKTQCYEKLKYLYYEVYDCEECDTNKMIERLLLSLKTEFETVGPKIYDFLKLTLHK